MLWLVHSSNFYFGTALVLPWYCLGTALELGTALVLPWNLVLTWYCLGTVTALVLVLPWYWYCLGTGTVLVLGTASVALETDLINSLVSECQPLGSMWFGTASADIFTCLEKCGKIVVITFIYPSL
jgi:hypothetical protein